MAIFSRRTLQRLIDENAKSLRRRQLADHVRRLDGANIEDAIAAEWEVAFINAFGHVGSVTHEPKLEETSNRFDLHFDSPDIKFIADIVSVSDKGLDELYPVKALFDQLIDLALKRGLNGNGFSVDVGADTKGVLRDKGKIKPKVPPRNRFDKEVFNPSLMGFLDAIRQNTGEARTHKIESNQIDISVRYDPTQDGARLSYLSYNQLHILVENNIYSRLQEKAEKLLAVKELAPVGIILCDGGCAAFRNRPTFASYDMDDVVKKFLRSFPEVSFVLTIFVEQSFGHDRIRRFVPCLTVSKSFENSADALMKVIKNAGRYLPEPEHSASNAVNKLRHSNRKEGDSFRGGSTVGDGMIKISARVVLDLLAGRITQDEFFRAQHFVPEGDDSNPQPNPFEDERSSGRLISNVEVLKQGDERDDDWLIFRFAGPDPAVSSFRVPAANSHKR